jgi:hypothetical protein
MEKIRNLFEGQEQEVIDLEVLEELKRNKDRGSISLETAELIKQLEQQGKLDDFYAVIDPEDIHFEGTYTPRLESGTYEDNEYSYKTVIAGKEYTFYVSTATGFYTENDGSEPKEVAFNNGRIDFSVEDGEYIANIGLAEIHKADVLIKDLFRFIYSKNRARYLIVEASKSAESLSASKRQSLDEVNGDKKQKQRLDLYERRLKKIGFEVYREKSPFQDNGDEEIIYAAITDTLIRDLYKS